jgi:hypothetical protein
VSFAATWPSEKFTVVVPPAMIVTSCSRAA